MILPHSTLQCQWDSILRHIMGITAATDVCEPPSPSTSRGGRRRKYKAAVHDEYHARRGRSRKYTLPEGSGDTGDENTGHQQRPVKTAVEP